MLKCQPAAIGINVNLKTQGTDKTDRRIKGVTCIYNVTNPALILFPNVNSFLCIMGQVCKFNNTQLLNINVYIIKISFISRVEKYQNQIINVLLYKKELRLKKDQKILLILSIVSYIQETVFHLRALKHVIFAYLSFNRVEK